jgi:GR25 family glycosyltransferase involved in LPS biosynthesis
MENYIYIKLSDNLENALYQLVSARVISEYQEKKLVIDTNCIYKDTIFKNYNFKNINCRNTYNENIEGPYNIFKTRFYRNNLQLIGDFKNINLFKNSIDEFEQTLNITSFENIYHKWKKEIISDNKNNNNNSLNLFSNKYVNSVEHRGGWKDVIKSLYDNKILDVDDADYYLIDIIEDFFLQNTNRTINKPWYGIIHSTYFVPEFSNYSNLNDILNNEKFKNNLKNCKLLITFSNFIKEKILEYNLGINVIALKHPIDNNNLVLFDIDKFIDNKNKHIVMLGKQLRKLSTIYLLKTTYKKTWLPGTIIHINKQIDDAKNELLYLGKNNINFDEVEIKYFKNYQDYDNYILNNIIIIDLWDANANNSIIECLIRNIPFFVTKLNPVVEYLGDDYPMYFNSINELEDKINNLTELYSKTYEYLKNIKKDDLSLNYFISSLKTIINETNNKNNLEIIYSKIKEHNNWTYVENQLKYLEKLNFTEKITFIPFFDTFILDNGVSHDINKNKIYENWIGILHNPDLSCVYPENDLFKKQKFINYLKLCKGLFVMSDELKNIIIKTFNPNFFIEVLYHPLPDKIIDEWDFKKFISNDKKKIIQVGNWLRKTYAIFKIKTEIDIQKTIIPYTERTEAELIFWKKFDNIEIFDDEYNQVLKLNYLHENDYLKLFSDNIMFLDLYNSTANNIILESIKSNCPLIINNNLNVNAYLGKDYPLYYNSYDEIPKLLTNEKLLETNNYLKNLNKEKFDINYFIKNIINILKDNKIINQHIMPIKNIIDDIPIFYINLKRANDRKVLIEDILSKNNLIYERIDAIDGLNLNMVDLKKIYNFRKISINEIACTLSHIKAIKTAYEKNLEYALIFEDDCSFEYLEFKKKKIKELINLNNDWEIIQLSMICAENVYNCIIKYKDEITKSMFGSTGLVAYIINKKGMKKVIEFFDKTKNLGIADEIIFKICNTYLTIPYFTQYCNRFKSDIRENDGLIFQNESKIRWDNYIKKYN